MKHPIPASTTSALKEFNPYHDKIGRFTSHQGGQSFAAPDGGSGGGASGGSGDTSNPFMNPRYTMGQLRDMIARQREYLKQRDIPSGGFGSTETSAEWAARNAAFQADKPAQRARLDKMVTALDARKQANASAKAEKAAGGGKAPEATVAPEIAAQIASGSIASLARMASRDWRNQGKGVNYAAKPYLDAMHSLDKVSDNYMYDSGADVVARFLGNATSWRGPVAKAVKAELNKRLRGK